MDSLVDPVVAFDKQWRYTYVSRRAAETLGKKPEELIGRSIWEVLPDDADTGFRAACERAWADGKPVTVERYSHVLDRWVENSICPFENGASAQWRDITERKRIESALRESERRYRSLFENSSDAVILAFDDGTVIEANPAACALFGMTEEEICRAGRAGLIDPTDARIAAAVEERRRTGHVRAESRHVRKDGSKFEGEISSVQIDEGRQFVIIRDVTERKRDEQTLRESEARFRFVVESSMMGVLFTDPVTGEIFDANQEFLRIVGRTRDDLGRLNWKEITAPGFLARSEEAIASALPDGRLRPFEKEYVRPDGSRAPVIVAASFLDDTRRRLVVFVLDRSEQKRSEERWREAQKLESIGLLAGGIAHDFNNLLVAVVGGASLALDMIPPESGAAELLLRVLKTGEQLAHLTRQLLAYAGKGRFVVEPLNLSTVIPEMIALVQPSIPKKVALHFELAPDLPLVEADRGQMQQVLMNLVFNAAEAVGNEVGAIHIRTGVRFVDAGYLQLHPEVDLPGGKYIYLEVRDTGCGMDRATLSRIFDPFFTTKILGRGLGLSAVSGIIRSHKGAITIESAPGNGSSFTVLLPIAESQVAPPQAERPAVSVSQVTGVVLIVDDELLVREMAGKALRRQGFEVLLAASAAEAIDVLTRHSGEIPLVVLDLSMPGMGGEEVLPELRRIRPEIRVVVSSGYDEARTMELFRGQSVSGFIQKPYTANSLVEKILSVMA
jgi:PAS domain S-box-containing protein